MIYLVNNLNNEPNFFHKERLGEQKNLTQEQKNHITEKDLDNFYCYDYEIENNDVASLKELARKIVMKEEEYHEL